VVYEDGMLLPSPHATHQDIIAQGAGRYSHWGETLLISTSDGTDPRLNGKIYEIRAPHNRLQVLAVVFLLLFFLLSGPGLAHAPEKRILSALRGYVLADSTLTLLPTLLAAYTITIFAFAAPPIPLLNPDSITYWNPGDHVPPVYPFFIKSLAYCTGTLHSIPVAQVTFYCTAVLYLQYCLHQGITSRRNAAIVSLCLLTYASQLSFALFMLTEQLFIALITLHCALIARLCTRPSKAIAISLAATSAIAVALRPAALFLYAGLFFLCVIWAERRALLLRWAVTPILLILVIPLILTSLGVLPPRASYAGGALYPHVAHLYTGGAAAINPRTDVVLCSQLSEATAPRRRGTTALERWEAETTNFNRILQLTDRVLDQNGEFGFGQATLSWQARRGASDAILVGLSKHAILSDPFGYARTVLDHLWVSICHFCLTSQPLTPDNRHQQYVDCEVWADKFFTTYTPRPPFNLDHDGSQFGLLNGRTPLLQFGLSPPMRFIAGVLFALNSLYSAYALAFLRRGNGCALLLGYTSILFSGGLAFASLTTFVIPRYALPLDTLLLINISLGGLCLADTLFSKATAIVNNYIFPTASATKTTLVCN
jgi:hypothetical protein